MKMSSFAHQEATGHCKYLAFLRDHACVLCHCSCIAGTDSISSGEEEEEEEGSRSYDFDYKHIIILEIQSRGMRRAMNYSFPTPEGFMDAPKGEKKLDDEEEHGGGGGDDDDSDHYKDGDDDAFFSVRSCFSTHCSSESGGLVFLDFGKKQQLSILEELCHCQGWPFGLGRKALMLPPLPSSPSDSWTWRKRNLGSKTSKDMS